MKIVFTFIILLLLFGCVRMENLNNESDTKIDKYAAEYKLTFGEKYAFEHVVDYSRIVDGRNKKNVLTGFSIKMLSIAAYDTYQGIHICMNNQKVNCTKDTSSYEALMMLVISYPFEGFSEAEFISKDSKCTNYKITQDFRDYYMDYDFSELTKDLGISGHTEIELCNTPEGISNYAVMIDENGYIVVEWSLKQFEDTIDSNEFNVPKP